MDAVFLLGVAGLWAIMALLVRGFLALEPAGTATTTATAAASLSGAAK